MSSIDMRLFDASLGRDRPGGPAERRRRARDAVESELRRAGSGSGQGDATIATCAYGYGCVALGIGGPVDRAAAQRLAMTLRDLRPHSPVELVVTLTLLGRWDPQLARVLGQARIHHLIDGGHLSLRDAPTDLLVAVGPHRLDTVRDVDQR